MVKFELKRDLVGNPKCKKLNDLYKKRAGCQSFYIYITGTEKNSLMHERSDSSITEQNKWPKKKVFEQ